MSSALEEYPWPPSPGIVENVKRLRSCNATAPWILDEYIRVSEYAIRLTNAVHEALFTIEEAEEKMTVDRYFRLIDSMHRLSLVGERTSDLYIQMSALAHQAMHRMNYMV